MVSIHYFYYDSTEKKWKDESGLEQTLTIHTDGTEQLVIHDKEDNQLRFRNGWLVKVQDKNGNCLSISWAEQRIISITDGSGRKTTLDYLLDNNGKRTTLTQITGPSGNKKTFNITAAWQSYRHYRILTGEKVNTSTMEIICDRSFIILIMDIL